MDYVAKRLQIGRIHQRIGVTPKLYLSGINRLQHLLEDIMVVTPIDLFSI
ncbi:protoglobin domain-containing protein [Photobacterium damselae subsp. piscicida]|nr:protoglobin domain-containing protein [Photobacterium damselae]MDP2513755.1 protoglobin domain-containing protein [Photobacterium damselae subsp. piscicida]MDP2534047.1 protoglobin domain-containing protein [Photobacterium damselae subsp. piscicida]MDP2544332.1 protoglobin domain-containing protein [Photobacterium damselae subsp. piscicida]MDP2557038.1 protoglobin domain-containing protein [Photobacterium damselae subsp. piscicida]MDP2568117.1 protoglobin domain-containing protein [Photobac